MLRGAKILAFCLFCTFSTCYAQQYVVLKTDNFTAVGSGAAVRTIGTAMTSSRLAWNISVGTLSACSVKAEQSATGTGGWSDFGLANTCTSNGSGAFISGTPNFIRITLVTRTVATGTPTLTVTFTGWMVAAGGGAAVGSVVVGGTTCEPLTIDSSTNLAQTPAVCYADKFSGADAGAKIALAIAALPATGGTVDARGFESSGSAAATITINKPVVLLFGAGNFTLAGSPGINVTADGVSVIGCGPKCTFLVYSGTGSAIKYKKVAATAVVMGGIHDLQIDGAGNANAGKKAIEIVDGEELGITNINISNWTDVGTHTSIGIELAGRQTFDVSQITINADLPFSILTDPNVASISLDHTHFKDIYTIAHSSQPNWKIADGVILNNVTWDGYQAWVNGTYGLYWNSTTDIVISDAISIQNVRWEQSTNATGYAIYLHNVTGIKDLNIYNCFTGNAADTKGYYIRSTANGSFIGNTYGGTTEAFNVGDGTVSGSSTHLTVIGNFFNTAGGATISTTGFGGGGWFGNDALSNISLARVPPSNGNQLVLSNNTGAAWRNAADSAEVEVLKLNAANQVNIASAGNATYTGGSLGVGVTGSQSHQVSIPNGTNYGGQNAANSDSIAIAGIDGSNLVNIASTVAAYFGVSVKSPLYLTTTNCADSAGAAACGAAPAGAFVIDATTTSTVVSTTAVTANSQIFIEEDSSLNSRLGITCNTQSILVIGTPVVTARSAGASFTATVVVAPTATPACFNYWVVN